LTGPRSFSHGRNRPEPWDGNPLQLLITLVSECKFNVQSAAVILPGSAGVNESSGRINLALKYARGLLALGFVLGCYLDAARRHENIHQPLNAKKKPKVYRGMLRPRSTETLRHSPRCRSKTVELDVCRGMKTNYVLVGNLWRYCASSESQPGPWRAIDRALGSRSPHPRAR
jgi:hypothetical protein